MWNKDELKIRGKEVFLRNYWPTVVVMIVAAAVTALGAGIEKKWDVAGVTVGVMILLTGPLAVGTARFALNNREGRGNIEDLAIAYKQNFGNVIVTMLLYHLFIALWAMLLVVPGIVKAYEYRMVPYILAENPDIDWHDAFALSKEMMNGQKMDAFMLDLSFIGWWLLTAMTGGVLGVFWTNPYYQQTCAEPYVTLRDQRFRA